MKAWLGKRVLFGMPVYVYLLIAGVTIAFAAFLLHAQLTASGTAGDAANGHWVGDWNCVVSAGGGNVDSAVTAGADLTLTFSGINDDTLIDCSRSWENLEDGISGINHVITFDGSGVGSEPVDVACTAGCGVNVPPNAAALPVHVTYDFAGATPGYTYSPFTVDLAIDAFVP